MELWTILTIFCVFSIVFFLYNFLRPNFKYRVNCHFCNSYTWVHLQCVNSFVCPICQQYNGFGEDGDYNRRIEEQLYTTPRRFCTTTSPDLVNSPRGRVNGLCEACNKNQQIVVERLNKFEAINEANYFDEYEAYKYRLNKAYPLCNKCESYTSKKLLDIQSRFTTPRRIKTFSTKTFSVGGKTASIAGSIKRSAMSQVFEGEHQDHMSSKSSHKSHPQNRKHVFVAGPITNSLNVANLGMSMMMFLACLETLRRKADFPFWDIERWMPHSISELLPTVQENLCSLALIGLLFHIYGARFSFNDLLAYPSWLALVILSWKQNPEQDLLLCQFGMISFLNIISLALVLLPKKRKHRKKPNTILSAFSVASTPASQCSSIVSQYRVPNGYNKTSSWFERMDTSDNMSSRESTPSRELGQKLIDLSLGNENEENYGRSMILPSAVSPNRVQKKGPFSSLSYNSFAQKRLNSCIPSKAGSTTSMFSASSTTSAESLFESRLKF